MVKKLKVLLLCSGALLGTSSFATSQTLGQGLTKEYDLLPNQTQTLANYLPWTITATCKVRTETQAKNTIDVVGLSKNFIVNGHILTQGEVLTLVVGPNDKIEIEADAHAQADLTNRGEQLVNLICKTN